MNAGARDLHHRFGITHPIPYEPVITVRELTEAELTEDVMEPRMEIHERD